MNRGLKRQVNPKVTAVIVLITLAAVQWFWWRGLVYKPPSRGGMPPPMGGMPPGKPVLMGREDVLVETLAGAPEPGDADGPGRNARFDGPAGLALDAQGNLYVADSRNHRIRRVAPDGKTSTVAGGAPGYADGPASSARFNLPCGVAVGPDGSLYVADTGNHRIRRIHDGQVTTLAGGPPGLADGPGASARFNLPCTLAFSPAERLLLVADAGNRRVRPVRLDGAVSGGTVLPSAPTFVAAWSAVAAAPARSAVAAPGSGGFLAGAQWQRGMRAEDGANAVPLRRPAAMLPAPDGWYLTDIEQRAVLLVRGQIAEVLAGTCVEGGGAQGWRDGPGNRALFGGITSMAADTQGRLYISDTANNAIRRVTLPGPGAAATDREELWP